MEIKILANQQENYSYKPAFRFQIAPYCAINFSCTTMGCNSMQMSNGFVINDLSIKSVDNAILFFNTTVKKHLLTHDTLNNNRACGLILYNTGDYNVKEGMNLIRFLKECGFVCVSEHQNVAHGLYSHDRQKLFILNLEKDVPNFQQP